MRSREQTFQTGSVVLNYSERGTGPPMVLLHGLAARWQTFGPLLPSLATDWRLYLLDLRGHGKSGRTPGRYRIPEFAADVVAFVRARVGAPVVLYGHSLGGWIALWVAAEHPDQVRAVVVGDSGIFPTNIDPDLAVSYLADLPIALRSLSQSLSQLDPEVTATFRAGHLTDGYTPEALLPRVRCPVLLLQADPAHGGLMTDGDVRGALALLPDARHVRLDGVGHGLHVEDAEPVLAAVRDFLAAHGGAPAG
jgi:pimeloyl-ACP methyl ester carboxylesterase